MVKKIKVKKRAPLCRMVVGSCDVKFLKGDGMADFKFKCERGGGGGGSDGDEDFDEECVIM